MNNKKTLIIGATGNVGIELVKLYAKIQLPFVAASRNPERIKDTTIETIYFDFFDESPYENTLKNIDRIFVIPPKGNVQTLYKEVIQFFEKAILNDVKHITFHSARAVEFIEQKLSNHRIEDFLKQSNISFTILRPNWFMQNFNGWFLGMMKQTGSVFLPVGNGKSCFIDTRDIAEVAFKTLTDSGNHNGKTYSLGGADSLNMQEALAIISQASGQHYRFVDISPEVFIQKSIERGMNENAARFIAHLFELVKKDTEKKVVDDAKNILGKVRTFEEYVHDNLHLWK